MRKRIAMLFALLLAMTVAAVAQIPTAGNVFFGYSYNRADTGYDNRGNLNGWEGSVEGKIFPYVGMVADVSGHYGNLPDPVLGDVSTRVHSYLFGPRVSFSTGKVRPFAHVLLGAAHLNESTFGFENSETDFADAIGGGVDYHLAPLVSWRVQLDDLQTRFNGVRQDDARFSTGLVFRF
jgi:hypothetical protein